MAIVTLGPEGTFSHEAALKFDGSRGIIFKRTVRDVFESVSSGEAEIGIVPIENSASGTVGMALDGLMDYGVSILSEIILPVKHHLAGIGKISDGKPSGGKPSEISTVYVQPQTYEQCEKFIRKNLQNARIIMTLSNADAAKSVAAAKEPSKAAIVSQLSIELYNLKLIKKGIQDSESNVTRFFAIGREGAQKNAQKSGKDKTSIVITPQKDRPGLLYSLLGIFAKRNINLTKIESRPAKGRLGEYIFFIDLEGHQDDEIVKEALKGAAKEFSLKILGSYPRAY